MRARIKRIDGRLWVARAGRGVEGGGWEGVCLINSEPNKGLRLTTPLSFAPVRHGGFIGLVIWEVWMVLMISKRAEA